MSQEKFGEMINSNLKYINELENCRRNLRIDMLDKIASGITNGLRENENVSNKLGYNKVTVDMLIAYNECNITTYKRVDEKNDLGVLS